MKKNISILSALLLIATISFSAIIPKKTAEKAAINFIRSYHIQKNDLSDNILISTTYSKYYNNAIVYFTVVFNNGDFVHISADDAAYPILGFSTESAYNPKVMAENYNKWMLQYAKAIDEIRLKDLQATKEITAKWNSLLTNEKAAIIPSGSVDPLLVSKWNQDSYYNAECPQDPNGPGGRVYAGCVAIAMAQIMYYYRYPDFGTGSHSYNHNTYGQQTANFGQTNYKWNLMLNKMPAGGNHQIAQLLYHLGVSVNMGYSASGSGAYSTVAANSLVSYFGYQSSTTLKDKSNYSNTQWQNMIIASLDNGIPLYYHGYNSQGSSGHAFNLDGYQGSDHFHFNWGWGGAYNGYFYLSAVSPGGSDFSSGQGAIFNIYPANNYPQYCNATADTLRAEVGTFSDGSGPSNYLSNSSCQWVIKPNNNIEKIKITFDKLSIANDDTLFIYDGKNASDPILGKYTGTILPSSIFSTNKTVLLKLVSNSANEDNGFSISYKAYYPVFCNGTVYLNDSIGAFSDGSNQSDYNSSTFCKWFIEPSNGKPIRLFFDNFNLENGADYVKIYDPTPTPSLLLGQFTGNTIPNSIVSTSGKMMIMFTSNASQNYSGWDAHYITGADVSIDNNEVINNIKIYPNPTSGNFTIEKNHNIDIKNISILNLDSRLIKQIGSDKLIYSHINISTNDLVKGIYFVKIDYAKGSIIKKIIVL